MPVPPSTQFIRRRVSLTLGTGCGRHCDALGVGTDVGALVCCWGSNPNSMPWGRQSGARDRARRHGSTSRDQLIITGPATVPFSLYLHNFYKTCSFFRIVLCRVFVALFSSHSRHGRKLYEVPGPC